MSKDNIEFAFGKKLGIAECMLGDIPFITQSITRLLNCMKQTNELHGVQCEFFRLDFRKPYVEEELLQEFPIRALVFDLKWGSKKELEEKQKERS